MKRGLGKSDISKMAKQEIPTFILHRNIHFDKYPEIYLCEDLRVQWRGLKALLKQKPIHRNRTSNPKIPREPDTVRPTDQEMSIVEEILCCPYRTQEEEAHSMRQDRSGKDYSWTGGQGKCGQDKGVGMGGKYVSLGISEG